MTNETRVGYVAMAILKEELKEYIKTRTIDGIYLGEVKYLNKYNKINQYLNSNLETRVIKDE